MTAPQDLKAKFWKALGSDMTLMLALAGVEDGHARPMTAQIEGDGDSGPIWFFTSTETHLSQQLAGGERRAVATYASKGHDVFATVHGTLRRSDDPATIDRLWNRYVAAWFEGGRDDPKVALLRFDPEEAEIWENGASIVAGIRMLFGADPKEEYKESVAKVRLG